jgi:nucleotide-binding universal stress UspA family protein
VEGALTYKTILAPATGSGNDAAVFASALTVARMFAAHLQFLHVRVDATAMAVAMSADGGGATLTSGLVERLETEADLREERARKQFDDFCRGQGLALLDEPGGQPGPSAQWLREIGGEPDWVADYGRAADLIVLARPLDGEGVAPETVEGALLESGRPLLIPPAAGLQALPAKAVIAWNASRESARAVSAATPLLALAKEIVVLTVAEEERVSGEEAARLVSALRWHGVAVSARHLEPGEKGAAETLLATAAAEEALLVMGGYGHSRLREWIFGGVTRHVLQTDMPTPILIAH